MGHEILCLDNSSTGSIGKQFNISVNIDPINGRNDEILISLISSIKKYDDYLSVSIDGFKPINVYYDGRVENIRLCLYRNHSIISIRGISFTIERFMLICYSILNGDMEFLYNRNLVCNVKDNSCSNRFINKYGIKCDLSYMNLEWCLQSENTWHYSTIIAIQKEIGHIYKISAKDKTLKSIVEMKTKLPKGEYIEILLRYLNDNYPMVK